MTASAVLFAKNLEKVATFYAAVTGLEQLDRVEEGFYLLGQRQFRFYIVLIPGSLANGITLDKPPKVREETPIKLVFSIDDIERARRVAPNHGGIVDPPEREWEFGGARRCDGIDPEGNVFQLAQRR